MVVDDAVLVVVVVIVVVVDVVMGAAVMPAHFFGQRLVKLFRPAQLAQPAHFNDTVQNSVLEQSL